MADTPPRDAIARLAGCSVVDFQPLSGGDVSSVAAVRLADGRRIVAKSGGPVRAEADMLRAIAATGCPAARVVAVNDSCLLMERLAEGRASDTGWAQAGHAVAALHAATGPRYGWETDHAIGPALQPAAPMDDWPAFWAERRLLAGLLGRTPPAGLARGPARRRCQAP
ncbi:fructosamine kinase family protein [Palleronia rufa]|uniref:fructosamine kinase family protein n=1 Tax=Palleronia rufa TaxID=1530186 RepID=UPI0022855593|nr:fructosamine kinase family protein [Palleronia rufa]